MPKLQASSSGFDEQDPRWRAVITRDWEADGRFVYCVQTTGIYCRPSCPARRARRENIVFAESAAAAERAGFRPCKRCRPESRGLLEQQRGKIVAICRTIPDFPMINARYDDEAGVVTRHGSVHLGMATQTDAGLMVPVIRDAQDRNVWQLAGEIGRLAEAARTGKAKSEELSGSTLTVTSLGPLGGIATTPVINRPEVAIIGPNKIVERPIFVGDDIVRAKLMNLSISCDHRVVDGWDAASFVQALKKLLETPILLFAA